MRLRLRFGLALPLAGLAMSLAGCDANQLYLGSKTVVGVNAAVSPDQTKGWLVIGYDRTFATVIPRSADDPVDNTKKDAMSALVCSTLQVKGITIKHFKESIATGRAAQTFASKLANDPAPVQDFFNCFKNKVDPEPSTPAPAGGPN